MRLFDGWIPSVFISLLIITAQHTQGTELLASTQEVVIKIKTSLPPAVLKTDLSAPSRLFPAKFLIVLWKLRRSKMSTTVRCECCSLMCLVATRTAPVAPNTHPVVIATTLHVTTAVLVYPGRQVPSTAPHPKVISVLRPMTSGTRYRSPTLVPVIRLRGTSSGWYIRASSIASICRLQSSPLVPMCNRQFAQSAGPKSFIGSPRSASTATRFNMDTCGWAPPSRWSYVPRINKCWKPQLKMGAFRGPGTAL